jgi:hypothetical protein
LSDPLRMSASPQRRYLPRSRFSCSR